MKFIILILGISLVVVFAARLPVGTNPPTPPGLPTPPFINKRAVVNDTNYHSYRGTNYIAALSHVTNRMKILEEAGYAVRPIGLVLVAGETNLSPRLTFVATKDEIRTNFYPVLRREGDRTVFPHTNFFVWVADVFSNSIVFFRWDNTNGAMTNWTRLKRYNIITNQTITAITNNDVIETLEFHTYEPPKVDYDAERVTNKYFMQPIPPRPEQKTKPKLTTK